MGDFAINYNPLNIIQAHNLALPETPEQWLMSLQQPTVVEVSGKEMSRWRVVSVLIHGNEPSGFFAAYEFLRQKTIPQTNLAIVISSVRAARHEPLFTHRAIPGEFDLNRRFGIVECRDRVTELAHHIVEYVRALCPELVVDLHNTSGQAPPFAVSISDHSSVRKMASLFCCTMVVTQLIVGSLMEQNFNCPIVTIECGGAGSDSSHALALEGLRRFAVLDSINELNDETVEVYMHPVRVKALPGLSLSYGGTVDPDADITLSQTIEQLNYGITPAGKPLGWLSRPLEQSLTAINDYGEDLIETLFENRQGRLIARQNLKLFMATGRGDIALSDCLFYVVIV